MSVPAAATLEAAIRHHQKGDLPRAEAIYRDILSREPDHPDALHLLGVAHHQRGAHALAADLIARAIALRPGQAIFYSNLGNAQKELGRLEEALATYRAALRLDPRHANAHYNLALALTSLGRTGEALASYDETIRLEPGHAFAHNNRANLLKDMKRPEEAITSYRRAVSARPDYAEAYCNLGIVLHDLGRFEEALASQDEAIRIRPLYPEAHHNRGATLKAMGRLEEALASQDAAIRMRPDYAEAHNNRGVTLQDLGRAGEALASFERAIGLRPGHAEAFNNRGHVLRELKRLDEALDSLDEAIRLKPDYASAYNNRGSTLKDMRRMDEAVESFAAAIRLQPDHSHAHNNLGNALREMKRLDEALVSYDEALRIAPGSPFTAGVAAHVASGLCDWNGLAERVSGIVRGVEEGRSVALPFALLSLNDDPALHRKASEIFVREQARASGLLGPVPRRKPGERIHLAYLSADFHDHATTHLMAQLFELHDRSRFELTAISFGPDKNDRMRKRTAAAFDRFEDVRAMTDVDVARRCRDLGVDIAIDLKGFTSDSRQGILAERCAPIQINWIGYPGTMGAPFIDYIIADHALIREADLPHYSEKVIWMPGSYQVNDGQRPAAEAILTRQDCGLPEQGFVFCCFNNNYKIQPPTFDVWMRILGRTPGSVLWLLEDNPSVARNLRAEAAARNVDPSRLVFAKRLPIREHMARHLLADLFIDTLPYNAHTTASDALWAGLPVLTATGQSFASRVGASLLTAVGMPELITHSHTDYEDLAVALAQAPARLAALKAKLERNRPTAPLFDCPRFTRHLEQAYFTVMEKYNRGEPPANIDVRPV